MSTVDAISTRSVGASPRSNWLFVEVVTHDGAVGLGEATHNGLEELVREELNRLGQQIAGLRPSAACRAMSSEPVDASSFARRIAVSALDQALWDIRGQQDNEPLRSQLADEGVLPPEQVALYANLNRALTIDRDPAAFGAIADRAVTDGFDAVKCAPFDGVKPGTADVSDLGPYMDGLARIRVVHDAIGPDTQLTVDCHWRFELAAADRVLDDLAQLGVSTIEAVVPDGQLVALARGGSSLSRPGVRLAAGEMATSVEQTIGLMETGLVDVVSPDVKYTGGVTALAEIARACREMSVGFSPHNPSGPVASLASAQVLAALGSNREPLEFPYAECPWRAALLSGGECLADGALRLPQGPGLGARLDAAVVAAHPPADIRRTVASSLERRGFLA